MSLDDQVGRLLTLVDTAFPTDVLPVLRRFLGTHAGATAVDLWLADYEMVELRTVRDGLRPIASASIVTVDGTDEGCAFLADAPRTVRCDEGFRVLAPVMMRDDRIGVLDVTVPVEPDPATLAGLTATSTTVAYMLTAACGYTDLYERTRRRQPLALTAEMQWSQLPPPAFTAANFALAGQVMPAYDVGGDLFDFTVDPGWLHVGLLDAMGHGLQASTLATLAITAVRNARRAHRGMVEQMQAADRTLFARHQGEQFVTGMMFSIELTTGRVRAVNAGHPRALLLRDGKIEELAFEAQLPLGMFEATAYDEQQAVLEPGDRLFLVSDGLLEASVAVGEQEFGEHMLDEAVRATAGLTPFAAVRRICQLVTEHHQGRLRDDATILCLEWQGPRT